MKIRSFLEKHLTLPFPTLHQLLVTSVVEAFNENTTNFAEQFTRRRYYGHTKNIRDMVEYVQPVANLYRDRANWQSGVVGSGF